MIHFKTAKILCKQFTECEAGTTAIEYSLIALLIAVATVGGVTNIGASSVVTLEAITSVFP